MKTRTYLALGLLLSLASGARAQENGGIVGPRPATGLPCFKLQDPGNQCVLAPVSAPTLVGFGNPGFHLIDLNGTWIEPGGNSIRIYLFGDSNFSAGYSIHVDMSHVYRPDGIGYVVDGLTISVLFLDDRELRGTIEQNGNQISWSNGTVWRKQ